MMISQFIHYIGQDMIMLSQHITKMVQAEYHDLTIHTLDRTVDTYVLTTYTADGACRRFQCSHNLYRSLRWGSLSHNLYHKWRRFLWSIFYAEMHFVQSFVIGFIFIFYVSLVLICFCGFFIFITPPRNFLYFIIFYT